MRISDWSSDVCSSDLLKGFRPVIEGVEVDEVEGANDPADPFPTVKRLLTVAGDFESWDALSANFFDEADGIVTRAISASGRSDEHTSELQSLMHISSAVFCLTKTTQNTRAHI